MNPIFKFLLVSFICPASILPAASALENVRAHLSGPSNGLIREINRIRPDWLFGAMGSGFYAKNPDRAADALLFSNEFNQTTLGIYQGSAKYRKGSANWAYTDPLLDYALSNRIGIHAHPILGGEPYTAKWILEAKPGAEELRAIMDDWMGLVFGKYNWKIQYIDVVNEALGAGIRGNVLTGELLFNTYTKTVWYELDWRETDRGRYPNYLFEAFEMARKKAAPGTRLIYNEWGGGSRKSLRGESLFRFAREFKALGGQIDGIGLQMHFEVARGTYSENPGAIPNGSPFDLAAFEENLKRYEKEGIENHITELDCHLPQDPSPQDFEIQGRCFAEVLQVALRNPIVKSFRWWGTSDRWGWQPKKYDAKPLLFDADYAAKPCYYAVLRMLREEQRR